MSVTELRNAPYNVLFEQADRLHAELATDTDRAIIGPLTAEGYEIPTFTLRFRQAIDVAKDLHARQAIRIADSDGHGPALSAAVAEAQAYLVSVQNRATVLLTRNIPFGEVILNLFKYDAPPDVSAALKDVDNLLLRVQKVYAEAPADLPGFNPAFRARVEAIRRSTAAQLQSDEGRETKVESSTTDVLAARETLVSACIEYVQMLTVVNHDRAAAGKPPLPGGNLETVRQWAATRPAAVASRGEGGSGTPGA